MSIQQGVAIYEDGTKRAGNIPQRRGLRLEISKSTDFTLRLQILRANGVPLDLAEVAPAVITLVVKARSSDDAKVLTKTASPMLTFGPGWVEFDITPADTRNLTAGPYVYSITLAANDEISVILPISAFILLPFIG